MHKVYTSIFSILNDYKYCVLRNAEGLPFENKSNDIDLLVDEGSFDEIFVRIKQVLIEQNYTRIENSEFYGIKCFTFYSLHEDKEPVKLDFFFNYCGGGLNYIGSEKLFDKVVINENGIKVLNSVFESFLNVLKTYLSGGVVKNKYLEQMQGLNYSDYYNEFKYLGGVIDDIEKCQNGAIELVGNRKSYLINIFKNNVKSIGFVRTAQNLMSHLILELKRISTSKRLIAICGIDGSGKSTLLEEALKNTTEDYKSIDKRFILEHHRPRLLPHISDIFKSKNTQSNEAKIIHENPRAGKVKGSLISSVKFFYYLLDYSLMFWIKHLNHLRRDKVVIYDRYYYDFLIDPERCALNVSPYLVKLSYKLLIPKPSITIYVTVPPQLAFQRKGELGLEESEILQNKYLENKNIWSESVVIDNIKLDTSILMFKNALVHGITSDLGDYVVK